jgi:methyltransferase (TIGR00027 family)
MVENRESITAQLCAWVRAWHSNTARQKIYDDYLAYDFMGQAKYQETERFIRTLAGETPVADFVNEYFAPIPLSRVPFTEERLRKFAEQGGTQYVICGAGQDTFSFRNEIEGLQIFEIDHPDTQRFKLDRIRQLEWNIRPNVHFVPVDFERQRMTEQLLNAGFDPQKPSFFSILGVTYYLTLDVFSETLRQIAALSAAGSAVVFDYPMKTGSFPARVQRLEQITAALGEHMRGGYDYNEVSRALYALGVQIDTYLSPEQVQAEYFAGRTDRMKAFENVSLLSAIYTAGYNFE